MFKNTSIKSYFITGLLIWVPLVITLWVLNLLVGMMDQSLQLLPEALLTENWLGVHVPGLGVDIVTCFMRTRGNLVARPRPPAPSLLRIQVIHRRGTCHQRCNRAENSTHFILHALRQHCSRNPPDLSLSGTGARQEKREVAACQPAPICRTWQAPFLRQVRRSR